MVLAFFESQEIPMIQKTLREDAHAKTDEICR